MPANAIVRARIDAHVKEEATAVYAAANRTSDDENNDGKSGKFGCRSRGPEPGCGAQLSDEPASGSVLGARTEWVYTEGALDSPLTPYVADRNSSYCAGCTFGDFSQRFAGSFGEDA
jgi:hypothetical protein